MVKKINGDRYLERDLSLGVSMYVQDPSLKKMEDGHRRYSLRINT